MTVKSQKRRPSMLVLFWGIGKNRVDAGHEIMEDATFCYVASC
jgi:hypothetical protein